MDSEVTKPLLLLDKEGSNINIPIRSCGMGCDVQNLTKNKEVRSLGTRILEEGSSIIDIPKRPCGMVCEFSDVENRTKDKEVRSAATQKLVIATGLCLVFIAVEVGGGLIANSLAILTDAAHLLSDVAGFGISLFAIWAASWQATPRQSYGFFRLEILGALLSIQLIWLLTGILVYEAIDRICHTRQPINGCLMFIIASFGFCVNLIMAFLLGHHGHSHGNHDGHHDHSHANKHDHHGHSHGNEHDHDHNHLNVETSGNNGLKGKLGHSGQIHPVRTDDSDIADVHDHHNCQRKHPNEKLKDGDVERGSISEECADDSNINVRGAYLHVLGDLIQSIGVMIGGAVIWAKPEWIIVDLICTLLFSLLVLGTTIKMLRDIVEILMESTPRGIDTCILEKGLCSIPGVKDVHDLHIWAITMGKTSLACHVTIESDADADAILQDAVQFCESVFKISHSTVQIERNTSL